MAICSRYGCQAEPFEVVAYEASHGSVMPSYSQARSQVGSPKLESDSIPGCFALQLQSAGRGTHVSRPQPATLA